MTRQSAAAETDHMKSRWEALKPQWTAATKEPFPQLDDSNVEWTRTAMRNPELLLRLLKLFKAPGHVLDLLSSPTLVDLTHSWREECILEGLMDYARKTKHESHKT